MKTNNSYLPLFFLCWAFLYTPLALLRVFPSEAKGRNTIDTGVLPKPGMCGKEDLVEVSAYGAKPFFYFNGASFVTEDAEFGRDAVGFMDNRFFGYGIK